MEKYLALTVNRQLLKYSAGRSIFCPRCQDIADAKRWVVVTLGERTMALCAKCWDANKHPDLPTGVDIADGRKVFKRGKK